MDFSTPCPRCQSPITLGQYFSSMSASLRCRSCGVTLHYKLWVWGVLGLVLLALVGALAGIGFDAILVDRAARAAMRSVFLVFILLGLGVSLVIFVLNPFTVRD